MPTKQDEKIRIYFSNDFNASEVDEITDSFNKILPTHGISNARICVDSIDATTVIQTAFLMVVVFVGLETIKGFFNSIGSDLKDKLIQALKGKKKPIVQFNMRYKNSSIQINAAPENWEEWKTIFETIVKAVQSAINEIEKDSQTAGIVITYDASVNGYWSVAKF